MECRHRIIRAAVNFYGRLGIKAVTMDFLAEQLGISKRTIYKIFRNKDDLVVECIKLRIQEHHLQINRIIDQSSNVIEAIYQISRQSYRIYEQTSPLFFHDLRRYHPAIFQSMFKRGEFSDFSFTYILLQRGINEGVFNKNLNINIINVVWQELISIMHDPEKFSPDKYIKEDLADNIMYPFIRGLCTGKGKKLLENYFLKIDMQSSF